MKIGIITVLFKSEQVLPDFIKCLNEQSFRDFEVCFIENDFENNACEELILKLSQFDYTFTRSAANIGVAAGNNFGINFFAQVKNITHLLFLNNDIEVDQNFLHDQVKILKSKPEIDALAPKMLYHNAGGKIWYAGGKISYLKEGPIHYGHNKPDLLTKKEVYRVSYAPTCSILIKKDKIEENGIRMWEELFVYYDDYTFCKDLRKAGVSLFYTPQVILSHKISSSTGGTQSEFSRFYSTRNWAYLVRIYFNVSILFLPFLLMYYKISRKKTELKALKESFKLKKND